MSTQIEPTTRPVGTVTETRVRLNVVALAISLTLVLVVLASVYFTRNFQLQRIAVAFIDQADRLEKQSDYRGAANYLYRYLAVRPDDSEIHIRLAKTYDRAADNEGSRSRSINLYYRALGLSGGNKHDLRRRLVELLLEQQRFVEAEQECGKLLDDPESNDLAEVQLFLARALYGQHLTGQFQNRAADGVSIGAAFEQAVESNPDNIELLTQWALILRDEADLLSDEQLRRWPRREDRSRQADAVIDQMVTRNATGKVFLTRFKYRKQYELPGAEEDLVQALSLEPDDPEILLMMAQQCRRQAAGEGTPDDSAVLYKRAREYSERAIVADPSSVAAYLELSEVMIAQGDNEAAIEQLQQARKSISDPNPLLLLRLGQLLVAQGRLSEVREVLDSYVDSARDQRLDANAMLTLDRGKMLLEAQWLMAQQEFSQAIVALQAVTSQAAVESQMLVSAWSQLGRCYEALKLWDQAAVAYEGASAIDSQQGVHRRMAAAAWMNADQPKRAVANYEQALAVVNSPATMLQLARARLLVESRSTEKRNWNIVKRLLSELEQAAEAGALSEGWRLPLLIADYTVARARDLGEAKTGNQEALDLLRESESKYTDEQQYWKQVALSYQALGSSADADRALDRFLEMCEPSSVDYYATSAQIHALRGETSEARQMLEKGLNAVSASDRQQLELPLIRLQLTTGDTAGAIDRLAAYVQENDADIATVAELGALYLSQRDLAAVTRMEKILQQREGADGTLWRDLRANRLLTEAPSTEDKKFAEAVELQEEIQSRRPTWFRCYSLKGRLEEALGNNEPALKAYLAAIDLGERRIAIYERLVALLYRAGRWAEADAYLARLDRTTPSSPLLSTVGIAIAASKNDLKRAELLARRAVDARPTDPAVWISYGQILEFQKQHDAAEQAIRNATKIAPNDVRGWDALFRYLLRVGERESARNILEHVSSKIDMSEAERANYLAENYGLLGDVEQAAEQFDRAVTLAPEDVQIQSRAVQFFLRHDRPEAIDALRRLMKMTAGNPSSRQVHSGARRALAAVLVKRGGKSDYEAAGRLLDTATADEDADKRIYAMILTQQPEPDFDKAQRLLEDLVLDRRAPEDSDRLQLALVYSQQAESLRGESRKAKLQAAARQFTYLCERANPQASHIVLFVELLFKQDGLNEVDRWLDRLWKVEPANAQLAALRARWVRGQSTGADQQKRLVERFASALLRDSQDESAKAQACLTVGRIYTELDMDGEAESWYEQTVKIDPERIAAVAGSFKNRDNAIAFCKRVAEEADSPFAATALARLLLSPDAERADIQEAELLLEKATEQYQDDLVLLNALGTVRVRQKREKEAIDLYRDLLEQDPKDVVALNNLAMLLSEDDQLEEALKYANQAIKFNGPAAPLFDTKGMILLQLGRMPEALDMLKAAASAGDDPRYQFHLAIAWHRLGETDKARVALRTAKGNDLAGQLLTETELQLLAELEQQLN